MRKRKYSKRGKGPKVKLKKNTIYTLSAIGSVLVGLLLLASYTQSGELLTTVNLYLTSYFGVFAFLIPINIMLLGLLGTKIKAPFTKSNVILGFIILTICLLGMVQSGFIGGQISFFLSSLLGDIVAILLFLAGCFVGIVVMFNITVGQIYNGAVAAWNFVNSFVSKSLMPLFKSKKSSLDLKQITIKGLDKSQKEETQPRPEKANPPAQKSDMAEQLILNKPLEIGVWEYPPLSLLSLHSGKRDTGDVKKIAATIEKTLQSFGIQARVSEINVGPSVTQYALEISLGTKLSKITSLANDLALATEAPTGQIRIEAPIPGRNLVGIEIPNRSLEIVSLKTMLESTQIQKAKSKLAVPLGLDVSGNPIIAELSKMPHILIAGTTGSGKSVIVNAFITSLLFRASPSEVKMIMIDPKRVELTSYNAIPHLLTPVVVEPEKAVSALKWAMKEMDRRYIQFAESGVRNIDGFNELSGFQALPYIIIFIDELADLMAIASVEVEDSIARLAQMARAVGIHLVLATQRPSVDVLTGLIKANIPARISFNVSSMIDSKVIIDSPGAEKLLGKGDMLYIPPDQARPTRIQGSFVSDQDVKRVVNFIKSRGVPVQYTSEVTEQAVNIRGRSSGGGGAGDMAGGDEKDQLFEQAVRIVCQYDKASSSLLQRRLSIGFNRAARIVEQLEEAGVVGPEDGSKPREVLIKDPDVFLSQGK